MLRRRAVSVLGFTFVSLLAAQQPLAQDVGKVTINSLDKNSFDPDKISSIQLLGVPQNLEWQSTDSGLAIALPQKPSYGYAYPIRIKVKGQLATAP